MRLLDICKPKLSRDMLLNHRAQQLALQQEIERLEKLEYDLTQLFEQVFELPDPVMTLDEKINTLFNNLLILINAYAKMTKKEAQMVVQGEFSIESRHFCDIVKQEMDVELRVFLKELTFLQDERAKTWTGSPELLSRLLELERQQHRLLIELYTSHSGGLEKIYTRYCHQAEQPMEQYVYLRPSSTNSLVQYFNPSSRVLTTKSALEQDHRRQIKGLEKDMATIPYKALHLA